MVLRRCAIWLSLWGCCALAAGGAEYFVDGAAPRDGDGSKGSPWKDAAAAVNRLRPGDVLTVRGTTRGEPRAYPNLLVGPGAGAPARAPQRVGAPRAPDRVDAVGRVGVRRVGLG